MNNYFNIRIPVWSSGLKYGWGRDVWGIGLNKARIDKLAEKNEKVIVSYWKFTDKFEIPAKQVQTYPVEDIHGSDVKVYIVPKTALRKKSEEEKLKEISILCS